MQNQVSKQVIRIPNSSATYLFDGSIKRRTLSDHPSNEASKTGKHKVNSVNGRMNSHGFKMDKFAQGIRDHVKLAPRLTETVKGKLNLGARILQEEFKQHFSAQNGEKLLKASLCYLSTTAGPIAGLLFISTDKIAFCSERSIKLLSPTGKLLRIYYKVSIPLRKIKRADTTENSRNPSQKYIELTTNDNFEFWFMGFLNHQKTMKYLQQVLCQAK